MINKLLYWITFFFFSVPLFAEIEITVDLLLKTNSDSKHELNRMVVFDGGGTKFIIERTFIFSGKKADSIKTELLKSVDTESLTGWAGNQPEYYFNIIDINRSKVLFRGFLSFRAQTWMVFDNKTGKPSIEAISDIKQLRSALNTWGIK